MGGPSPAAGGGLLPTRRSAALLLPIAVLLLATACVGGPAGPDGGGGLPPVQLSPEGSEPTAADRRGGSLRVALQGDPAAIDPALLTDSGGELVADAVFDSLVALDEDLEAVPAAASDWRMDDDGRTYTFRLRAGARFHDGEPVTAEDFVRAFQRIVAAGGEERSFVAGLLAPVAGFAGAVRDGQPLSGVTAVDPETLRIRLRRPDADFLTVLSHPALGPVPATAVSDPTRFAEQPVGNGPFVVDQPWEHDQFIRLRRFDQHRRPPLLDEVVFQIYPGDAGAVQQYEEFQEGGLDVSRVPPTTLRDLAVSDGGDAGPLRGPGLIDDPSLTVYFYGLDVARPPMDDPALRRAVSLAVDREAVTEQLLRGTRRPAMGIVPPAIPGARTRPCDHCRHDPEAARAALERARADGPVDQPLQLLHNAGRAHEAIAELVARQLRSTLGVTVQVSARDGEDYLADLRAGEADLFRFGWQAPVPTMGAVLEPLFTSDGEHNLVGYADPEVDRTARRARAELDAAARRRLWQRVEQAVLDDVAVVPLFVYRHDLVVAEQVRDFRLQPGGAMNLDQVWLEQRP